MKELCVSVHFCFEFDTKNIAAGQPVYITGDGGLQF